jgi:hypothetical protein
MNHIKLRNLFQANPTHRVAVRGGLQKCGGLLIQKRARAIK